jgi:very-short-patch-repair endonuclease
MPDALQVDPDMRGEDESRLGAIAGLASRQHGVVARRQLLRLGLRSGAVDRMVAGGLLHPLHRGVYAVGHTRVSAHGRTLAAVLAFGSRALASHLTAAWLWGLLRDNRAVSDVTVAARGGGKRPGVVLHTPRRLHDEDRAVRDAIPCTSVARTLLDIADERPALLPRAYEEAERRRLLDLRSVRRAIERNPGHRGRAPLERLVAEAAGPVPVTRSELERAFLELIASEGLPVPVMNAQVLGKYEVDALWPDRRVIVEIDHYATHGHRTAFERDRVRDTELQIAGFRTSRVTDVQMTRPREVVERMRRLLCV